MNSSIIFSIRLIVLWFTLFGCWKEVVSIMDTTFSPCVLRVFQNSSRAADHLNISDKIPDIAVTGSKDLLVKGPRVHLPKNWRAWGGAAAVYSSSSGLAWSSALYFDGKPLQFFTCESPQISEECLHWPHKHFDNVLGRARMLFQLKAITPNYSWCIYLEQG